MSMNGLLVVGVSLCAGVLALPEAARGQATLVLDERYVQAELQLQDFGGTAVGPSTMVTPTSLGAAFNQSFGYSGHSPAWAATGECLGTQVSQFDSVPNFRSVVASGTSMATARTDSDALFAEAGSKSQLQFQFSLSAAMEYEFSGTLAKSSTSGATVRARLRPVGEANIFMTQAAGAFSSQGTLQPGTYEVHVFAASLYSITDSNYFSRQASFDDVEFKLVPEPASLALLAAALPLAMRRRRGR